MMRINTQHPPESLLQPEGGIRMDYMQIAMSVANHWKENNEMAKQARGKQKLLNKTQDNIIQRNIATFHKNW